MQSQKESRWRQRFDNLEKAYRTFATYIDADITSELERAGLIQLFEVAFELSWKVLKDYLEAEGFQLNSPRETLKTAFQASLIENGHVWIDALSHRNLIAHTYDEETAERLVEDITGVYFPEIRKLYERLKAER